MNKAVRWTIVVSEDTDLSLRAYLGNHGMKKGDLSRFVEEAVRWRVMDQTVSEMKARNRDRKAQDIEALIDDEVRAVRSKRSMRPLSTKPTKPVKKRTG